MAHDLEMSCVSAQRCKSDEIAIWKRELNENIDCILAPNGHWLKPMLPLLPFWPCDVWCDPGEVIATPSYEQGMARFMESAVAAGHCGKSGSARLNFVLQHVTDRAQGDLFDWNRVYIDRETLPRRPEEERKICDAFGKSPRRTMNRLKGSVVITRTTLLRKNLLEQACWLSLARKVFLARAGYPEYCERRVY